MVITPKSQMKRIQVDKNLVPAEVIELDEEPVSAFTRLNDFTFKRKIESSDEKFDLTKKPLFIDSGGSRICWSSGTIARWFIWQLAATRVTIECCNACRSHRGLLRECML